MATATEPTRTIEASQELEGHPVDLTADQFFGMIESSLFAPESRVFLWDGRVYEKMAKTPAHAITSYIFHKELQARLPDDWLIWPENPIRLDPRHAPMPDIAVIRGPLELYLQEYRHPEAGDVGLLVEIAVSSLPKDLGNRAEKFARAMVPAYWVADVFHRRVVEHRDPRVVEGVGAYGIVRTYGPDEELPLIFRGQEVARIPVRDLLPERVSRGRP